jgi:regulator of sigma E protease
MYMYLFAVLLLGIVVFIHELGHFLFAKLFNVKVLAFSLGFGKPLLKWKKGDTEYRISMIPLGGYVKMLGEGPAAEQAVREDEMPFSYSHKVWWQKVIIAFAGAFFNIVSAFIVFLLISFYNYTAPAPVIEFVEPGGPAYVAGVMEGDTVTEISGRQISVWEDIQNAMMKSGPVGGECPEIEVTVKKAFTGTLEKYSIKPNKGSYNNLFDEKVARCEIGIARLPKNPAVAFVGEVPLFQNGDIIRSVDSKTVSRFYELSPLFGEPFEKVSVLRGKIIVELDFSEEDTSEIAEKMIHAGTMISKIDDDSFSQTAGFLKGDIIRSINGKDIFLPYQFYSELRNLKENDTAEVAFIRNNTGETISFKPIVTESDNKYTGLKDRRVSWGAYFSFDYDVPEVMAKRSYPLVYTFRFAIDQTVEVTETTLKGFAYLITGKLSTKSIGGPIMIFDISKKAAEAGLKHFLFVLAVISINLGIINLFPVPILDGGHIVMYTFEGLTRKTIPLAVKEKMLTAGLVLLLMLMAFAIFNDFSRYISVFMGI